LSRETIRRLFEEELKTALSKLPPKLQENFFEYAEEAARKTVEMIVRDRVKISNIGRYLSFRDIPDILDRELVVGVVDGSSSPTFNDRLGYRIGVYTACYMVFEGDKIISDRDDESMEAGYMMVSQTGDILQTHKILSLLMTSKERELALRCMKNYDVDIMLIDGAFYGFRTRCSEVKKLNLAEMGIEGYRSAWDLIERVLTFTRHLVRSGKAVAVIKRLRTSAIDGWILSKTWSISEITKRNDRSILRMLLPYGKYFNYRDFIGDRWSYLHYSSLISWYNDIVEKKIVKEDKSMDENTREALEYVDKKLKTQIHTDLCQHNTGSHERDTCAANLLKEITSRPRIHVRLSPYTAPVCLEIGENVDLEMVLAYVLKSANLATGLPFPIDLVDEMISIDRELAKEFAEEVEARLLLNREVSSDEVESRLEPLNPQKEI